MMNSHNPSAKNNIGFTLALLAFISFFIGVLLYAGGYMSPKMRLKISDSSDGRLVIRADPDHHYRISGEVNGVNVIFLLDTGAGGVALSEKMAEKTGVRRSRSTFTVQTANGTVEAQGGEIERLLVGPIDLSRVPVMIVPDMDDEILLGMSVLRRFRWQQENGALVLFLEE